MLESLENDRASEGEKKTKRGTNDDDEESIRCSGREPIDNCTASRVYTVIHLFRTVVFDPTAAVYTHYSR